MTDTPTTSLSVVELARRQIDAARQYTLGLLADVREEDLFRQPDGCPTHLAWQLGHMAFAEYALGLVRVRGRQEGDDAFLPPAFRRRFAKRSQPAAITADLHSAAEIRSVLDAVHARVMQETADFVDADLQEEIPEPHFVFTNKLGALLLCSHHEMLHAGQIGLLRRLLGYDPVR